MDPIDSKKAPKESTPKRYNLAFLTLVILAVSFGGGWLGAASQRQSTESPLVQQKTILKNEANVISDIAKDVGPSVVSVNVTSRQTSQSDLYSWFFGFEQDAGESRSAGTGIILDESGLIITNRHVIPAGVSQISVSLSDGTVLDDVEVVGRTNSNDSLDIAFLKITNLKGSKLTPAKIGDSSLMKVGDSVVAIGNTLGQFQNTVTSGIISGYGRSIQASGGGSSVESLDDLFQTDAAINQGNSGGPLVNLAGEVIGINTAIASNAQTVGFAIPINNVIGLISSVKDTGKLQRPYLGVRYVMVTDDIAKEYNLSVDRGVYIPRQTSTSGETVLSGGPAGRAGIEPGDVITKIGDKEVGEKASVASILGTHRVGDSVDVTIVRGSETRTVNVTLEAAPSE